MTSWAPFITGIWFKLYIINCGFVPNKICILRCTFLMPYHIPFVRSVSPILNLSLWLHLMDFLALRYKINLFFSSVTTRLEYKLKAFLQMNEIIADPVLEPMTMMMILVLAKIESLCENEDTQNYTI